MAAPAPAAASRKRRAPDDDGASTAAPAGKKHELEPYDYEFRSIHDYEQLEVLGEGSFGVVVKALDRRNGETVAVKMARRGAMGPDPRAVVREAGRLAECLGYPSVVQIRDLAAHEENGELFLVMEFAGPSLRRLLRQRRFTVAETREHMRQLLGGAAWLHDVLRMVHRDIKPANILVCPGPGPGGGAVVKLCDFGMAASVAQTPYPEPRVGTLWYRSPEQLKGGRSYGPGVDVWALGCVMVELLTGEPLFGKADDEEEVLVLAMQLRQEIVSAGPDAFSGLPEPLSPAGREVLRGLLCYDPEERLTAAEALRHRWFNGDEEEEEKATAVAEAEHRGSMHSVVSCIETIVA